MRGNFCLPDAAISPRILYAFPRTSPAENDVAALVDPSVYFDTSSTWTHCNPQGHIARTKPQYIDTTEPEAKVRNVHHIISVSRQALQVVLSSSYRNLTSCLLRLLDRHCKAFGRYDLREKTTSLRVSVGRAHNFVPCCSGNCRLKQSQYISKPCFRKEKRASYNCQHVFLQSWLQS